MQIRDRITELRRVRAGDLTPSPQNWREHPESQRKALAAILGEVGYADACLTYTAPDGRLTLFDGHLRQSLDPDQIVPCLVTDLTEAEARKMMTVLDPLAGMAEANAEKLTALMAEIETESADVRAMLEALAAENPVGDATTEEELPEAAHTELDDDDSPEADYLAPFPWFGGKSRIAKIAWKRFGDVPNYIEPFFGSGAMLLNRPLPADGTLNFGNETVNDFDALVCNFWRATIKAPKKVAGFADWPVNESDLHARHAWLVGQKDALQTKLEGDPEYCDAKIAGWWAWGMACWIGGGFCSGNGPWGVVDGELVHLSSAGQGVNRKLVHMGPGRGVNRKLVHLGNAGQGVNRKLVHLGDGRGDEPEACKDAKAGRGEKGLLAWIQALAERLRRVRVCCGDWTRICGGNSGDALGHFFAAGNVCAVFLDPPYADTADRQSDLYRVDSTSVAHAVREWAIAHGDDPRLRIALCGYEGEHVMPANWETVRWKAHGGMSSVSAGNSQGKENAHKERVWFSPHCLRPAKAPSP